MKKVKIAAGLAHVNYGILGDLVEKASQAGVDYIHAEAADMHVLTNEALMGGFRDVMGIRDRTELPIELHCYINTCSLKFIDQVADAGANMIILPIDHFLGGAPLAFFIKRARERGMKFGLFSNCITPAFFFEEVIYWIDRIHVVTHGVEDKYYGWRRSVVPMIEKLRKMIDEKKPEVELACDGGILPENLEPLVLAGADVLEFSRPIFENVETMAENVRVIRSALDNASRKIES
ncbi:MAG: pentose-5-phosphate 3-epimerase [Anaerolineaceae bacterium]|jgi:pentose-5-phosphate-3-epimerase|nr:MAG: pentose-5-phosphate 3-epimerase [Anaerolineaceae bacterium]